MTLKRKKSGKQPAEKKVKKVSDARLVEMGLEYEELRLAAKAAEDARKKYGEMVTQQFALRGTDAIIHGGVKVSSVETETVEYDYHGFKADLDSKTFRRIRAEKVDGAKILVEVAKGTISKKILARNSKVKKSAPYPKVTRVKEK